MSNSKKLIYLDHPMSNDIECFICLQVVSSDAVKISCHDDLTCAECIGHWFGYQSKYSSAPTCPKCRVQVDTENLKPVPVSEIWSQEYYESDIEDYDSDSWDESAELIDNEAHIIESHLNAEDTMNNQNADMLEWGPSTVSGNDWGNSSESGMQDDDWGWQRDTPRIVESEIVDDSSSDEMTQDQNIEAVQSDRWGHITEGGKEEWGFGNSENDNPLQDDNWGWNRDTQQAVEDEIVGVSSSEEVLQDHNIVAVENSGWGDLESGTAMQDDNWGWNRGPNQVVDGENAGESSSEEVLPDHMIVAVENSGWGDLESGTAMQDDNWGWNRGPNQLVDGENVGESISYYVSPEENIEEGQYENEQEYQDSNGADLSELAEPYGDTVENNISDNFPEEMSSDLPTNWDQIDAENRAFFNEVSWSFVPKSSQPEMETNPEHEANEDETDRSESSSSSSEPEEEEISIPTQDLTTPEGLNRNARYQRIISLRPSATARSLLFTKQPNFFNPLNINYEPRPWNILFAKNLVPSAAFTVLAEYGVDDQLVEYYFFVVMKDTTLRELVGLWKFVDGVVEGVEQEGKKVRFICEEVEGSMDVTMEGLDFVHGSTFKIPDAFGGVIVED